MTPVLSITLPHLPPKEYSANARNQWWDKRGKRGANNAALADVWGLVKEQGWDRPPLPKARCVVTFHFPTRHRRDHGSFVERMKPLWDAMVRCGIIIDDNLEVIGWPEYGHQYRKPAATVIEVYEL